MKRLLVGASAIAHHSAKNGLRAEDPRSAGLESNPATQGFSLIQLMVLLLDLSALTYCAS